MSQRLLGCMGGCAVTAILLILLFNPSVGTWTMGNNAPPALMKTVCVGRHLVDLPQDFEISMLSPLISTWRITSDRHETDVQFDQRLAGKEASLRAAKNRRDLPSLEIVRQVNGRGLKGAVFVYDRNWLYWFEMGKRKDSQVVSISARIRLDGVSFDFDLSSGGTKDIDVVLEFIRQLRVRKPDEIPDEPGFCFDDGFIRDPRPGHRTEFISVVGGYRSHPDMTLRFTSHAGTVPPTSLLPRAAQVSERQEHPSDFKVIFKGPRTINGIPGEELAEKISEANGTRGHVLMWESFGKDDTLAQPTLALELSTGHGQEGAPVNSSLSDKAVLALWEQVSSSIRLRPVKSGAATTD